MSPWRLALLLVVAGVAPAAEPVSWSPTLIGSPAAWSVRMNDARVSVVDGALRVAVAPGRQWAIAAVPAVLLPAVAEVRVTVRGLGGDGQWLMRLHGDVRGDGRQTTICPFQSETATGAQTVRLDPRVLRAAPPAGYLVQFGVEGPPGAWVEFAGLDFAPRPPTRPARPHPGQLDIACVELMPNLPTPYKLLDWRAKARAYDRFVFDFAAQGQHLPLIWLDESRRNLDGPTFGLTSYVGDRNLFGSSNAEGVTCLGAVLGATLAGVDKRAGRHDYVRMCAAWVDRAHGTGLVLNHPRAATGGSFWYEIFPSLVFFALLDRYPDTPGFDALARGIADRWQRAYVALGGSGTATPDFDHTAFNHQTGRPVDNGKWREPDAAAGVAWLAYAAWQRWHDPRHLEMADGCLRFLHERKDNPYYEVLLPFGALTCARANAELGRGYDLSKLVDWCFGISDCRGGWGVTLGRWGDYDCAGLVGSVDNRGGYAFALNTFCQAGALVPIVRYDPRFGRALGKWLLNLANAARLFYPSELPKDQQSCARWTGDPQATIAYEGLRYQGAGQRPYATGDPVPHKWGPETNLGLYGSSYVGFLGALVGRTEDERILALDCLATDFHRPRAYPTWLLYNPYPDRRAVTLTLGPGRHDLYDLVSGLWIARGVGASAKVTLPIDNALVVVACPSGAAVQREGRRLSVGRVVVDWGVGR